MLRKKHSKELEEIVSQGKDSKYKIKDKRTKIETLQGLKNILQDKLDGWELDPDLTNKHDNVVAEVNVS